MAASTGGQESIKTATPSWLAKEGSLRKKQRLAGRLIGTSNYTAMNITMRIIRSCFLQFYPDAPPNLLLPVVFKTAAFTLLLIASLYIVGASRICTGAWFPVLLLLTMISFRFIGLPYIAPLPSHHYLPFFVCYPRGAGSLIIIAIFLFYAAKRPTFFALSALILGLYHVGLMMTLLPLLATTIIIVELAILLTDKHSHGYKPIIIYPGILLTLFTIGFLIIKSVFADMPQSLTSNAQYQSGNIITGITHWHLPFIACLFCRFLPKQQKTHCNDTNQKPDLYSRLLVTHAVFLFVTWLVCIVCQTEWTLSLLSKLTNSHLIDEIPDRLSTVLYITFLSFLVFLGWGVWEWVKTTSPYRRYAGRYILPFVGAIVLLFFTLPRQKHVYYKVTGNSLYFFNKDYCEEIQSIPLSEDTLPELDTKNEPVFFLSLAEYLYNTK